MDKHAKNYFSSCGLRTSHNTAVAAHRLGTNEVMIFVSLYLSINSLLAANDVLDTVGKHRQEVILTFRWYMWINEKPGGAGPLLISFSQCLVLLWLWASWFTSLYVSFLTHEVEIRLSASFIGLWGTPGGSDGKESACNAGDLCSIPGLGRFPGEGQPTPVF